MSLTSDSMTPADIAACTGGGNNNGWGDNGWWLILLFLFAFCGGWGNGFGGGNGAGVQGSLTRGDLCMDMNFNDLQNGVRNINDAVNLGFSGLNSTICHQQYDTAMLINGVTGAVNNGFSGLNSTICQQQYDTASQLNAMNIANMQNANAANVVALQNANAIQSQLAGCCCEQRAATEGLKFTIAQEDCATRNLIQSTTRDMIESNNANARAILQKLDDQAMAAKDAQITALNQQLFAAQLSASQGAQTSQIINTLRPFPVASYQVCNPFTGTYGYPSYAAGCGCGCNG